MHTDQAIAVEVADNVGTHFTTLDGFATVEEAVDYWRASPGMALGAYKVNYFTEDGVTVGAEVRGTITGSLLVQFLAHEAGWVPTR